MEATFDEDTTLIGQGNDVDTQAVAAEENASGKGWQKVVIGGVAGIVLGGTSTMLMGMNRADNTESLGEENNDVKADETPAWSDGNVGIATSVNDDMKFGEAFAAARHEVGPGGAFEWHGKVYGTYTADEWNGMSAQEKAQYNDHFSWNHHTDSSHHNSASYAHQQHSSGSSGELEVVAVEESHNDFASVQVEQVNTVADSESEVEVLGIMQDADTGAIVAGMTVDGQEAIVVDFDGDLTFDILATDANNNGLLENNEVVDIQNQGITVDGLSSLMNPGGEILTSIETPDFTLDSFIDI